MPKFLTYQRPAPVAKQNWNHAPDRKTAAPHKEPTAPQRLAPTITVPALEKLIRKE